MKTNFSKIHAILFFSLCAISFVSFSQEGLPAPTSPDVKELNLHPELNLDEDKTLIMEPHDAKATTPIFSKEVQLHPAKAKIKGEAKPSEKEETDPLAFNFLYLIIQKFKISDIVD